MNELEEIRKRRGSYSEKPDRSPPGARCRHCGCERDKHCHCGSSCMYCSCPGFEREPHV